MQVLRLTVPKVFLGGLATYLAYSQFMWLSSLWILLNLHIFGHSVLQPAIWDPSTHASSIEQKTNSL